LLREPGNDLPGSIGGTIVADDELEACHALIQNRSYSRFQNMRVIVGQQADRNLLA
jgi:hypothetical protein